MITFIVCAVAVILFVATWNSRKPRSRQWSIYYCATHEGNFSLPGAAPYAVCPECKATLQAMEQDILTGAS